MAALGYGGLWLWRAVVKAWRRELESVRAIYCNQ